MYLVEIEAGREEMYDSVDALASAIRRGDVGPQARIFHRASSSWVSITVHPEFKKATASRHRGLRALLGRAFRRLSPTLGISKPSGT